MCVLYHDDPLPIPCNNINRKELYDFYYTAITLTTGYIYIPPAGIPHEVGFLQTTYTVMEGEDAIITYGVLTDGALLVGNDFAAFTIELIEDTATRE